MCTKYSGYPCMDMHSVIGLVEVYSVPIISFSSGFSITIGATSTRMGTANSTSEAIVIRSVHVRAPPTHSPINCISNQ